MKSHNLNYSRKIAQEIKRLYWAADDKESRVFMATLLNAAKNAQKFMLPDGGRILGDAQYRALDTSVELRLPFQMIALEYPVSEKWVNQGDFRSSKRAVFAIEMREEMLDDGTLSPLEDPQIMGIPAWWRDDQSRWLIAKPFFISQKKFIERGEKGLTKVLVRIDGAKPEHMEQLIKDYQDEIHSLMDFLNALQCINVSIEKRPAPRIKTKKSGKALPFDDYHVLVVSGRSDLERGEGGGSHRAPREHLRRGHIRRLADGRKVWVNATVVCPGKGGSIKKDYLMKRVSAAMREVTP